MLSRLPATITISPKPAACQLSWFGFGSATSQVARIVSAASAAPHAPTAASAHQSAACITAIPPDGPSARPALVRWVCARAGVRHAAPLGSCACFGRWVAQRLLGHGDVSSPAGLQRLRWRGVDGC